MTPGKLFILLIGIGLSIYAVRNAWRNYQARNWPTAKGLVTRCELHPDGDAIELLYEYEVQGRRYQSDRLCYLKGDDLVANAAQKFGVGTQPDVHFDPADPSRATLVRLPPREGLWALLFPVIYLSTLATVC